MYRGDVKERTRREAGSDGDPSMSDNEIRQAIETAIGAGGLSGEADVMDRLAGNAGPFRQISAGPPDSKPKPSIDMEELDEFLERVDRELGLVALNSKLAARVHVGQIATQRVAGPES